MGSEPPRPIFNPSSTVPFWLDGKEKTTNKTFNVISPHTGEIIWKSSAADSDDVTAAISSSKKAFQTWRWSKPRQRREIFLRAHEILKERKAQSFAYSHTETGAPEEMFGLEYGVAMDICVQLAGLAGGGNAGTMVEPDAEGVGAMVIKEPYGVVLAIAPWNAPFILGLRACLFPIAAGNTVILKGPELAPATYWYFTSVLHEAGLPVGVLNTIYHDPNDASVVTNQLIADRAVRKVKFTGSDAVGAIIAEVCGRHLKPHVMELGGKGAIVICDDADLQKAAFMCLLGAFFHAGQVCMSTERIIVAESVLSQFKVHLAAAYEQNFGAAKDPCIFVSEKMASKPRSLVQDAVSKGATLLHGDLSFNDNTTTTNNKMRPVVLEGVTPDMEIYHKESFGPTVSLFSVTSDEAAVAMVNSSDYGLSAAVFTSNLERGMWMARRIEAGAVHVNGLTVHDEANLPMGGTKRSGFGRLNGELGLSEWVQHKTITWKESDAAFPRS